MSAPWNSTGNTSDEVAAAILAEMEADDGVTYEVPAGWPWPAGGRS